jgi:hypothetical protein
MPTLTGGDGNGTQFCKHRFNFTGPAPFYWTILVYVGYWPTQSAVVVAHQGTDPHKLYVLVSKQPSHTDIPSTS